jgi:hypothetical protein
MARSLHLPALPSPSPHPIFSFGGAIANAGQNPQPVARLSPNLKPWSTSPCSYTIICASLITTLLSAQFLCLSLDNTLVVILSGADQCGSELKLKPRSSPFLYLRPRVKLFNLLCDLTAEVCDCMAKSGSRVSRL